MSTSFQKYYINKDIIYDYECSHNNRKKLYNRYCKTCKKNICNWCKGHDNHNIINLDSIEPNEETYDKFEKQLMHMKSIGDELNKKYLKIFKAKENINRISKLINEVYEQLKNYTNEFESHLKFNSTIFNSYKKDKRNYYILSNFSKLDFTSESKYLDNLDKNQNIYKAESLANLYDDNKNTNYKLNGKSEFSENGFSSQIEMNQILVKERSQIILEYENKLEKLKEKNTQLKNSLEKVSNYYNEDFKQNKSYETLNGEEEKNMWISEKYCKNWGLREAIREFIQNQYDGVITQIGTKKNLLVEKTGSVYNFNGRNKFLEYDFIKKDEYKQFGKIRYDKRSKNLSISNKGELFLSDFLLGGSKDEENNVDIIGTFGEGMKLAILALCRLEKEVIIISSKKKYSFRLKEDFNFIKNSIPIKCLHCKIGENNDDDCNGQVKVIIKNMSEDEWANQIDNFLWLLGNDIEIYTSVDENNNELGQIIYESYLKNRIYVKGIFVQELKEDKDLQIPGFNAVLKLDRDRNCVQDRQELRTIISKIISGTLNKNIDYIKHVQQNTDEVFIRTEFGFEKTEEKGNVTYCKSELKNLTKDIINCLESKNLNIINYYDLINKLKQDGIDVIWNEMNSRPENNNKQPVDYKSSIDNFIKNKKLPEDFYPCYEVKYDLFHVLEKSSFYIDIETKFANYAEKTEDVVPKNEYKIAIKEICSKIQLKIKEFNEDKIKFKKFGKIDENLCFKHKEIIYFSSTKLEEELNEEWKFWIFVKILNISDIKIEDSYNLFRKTIN